ncbi:MAG: FAD binding domain-containing protein [bacterium]
MDKFEYVNVTNLDELPTLLSTKWDDSVVLAGGTDLLDRLKERLSQTSRVINIKNIQALKGIKNGRTLEIGALATIAEIASDRNVRQKYLVLAQAAGSIATPQLRNMGTVGGNLCQRPRCWYYRGRDYHCLKKGGDTCYAAEGLNKYHAIFGGGPCYIVHPSDLATALTALAATIEVFDSSGRNEISADQFFVLPDDNLERENVLAVNQIITKVILPEPARGTRSTYLKFRQKDSQDFAMSSVAAVLQMEGNRVQSARIVLGGVAPIPWRVQAAEAELEGKALNAANIDNAAAAAVANASPLPQSAYKVQLTRNLVRRALQQLAEG